MPPASNGNGTNPIAGKYLTFFVDGEEYGVEILKVHEIVGMLPITRVPRMPAFVRGVVNLRGKVIPVIDLRRRFGLEGMPDDKSACIIVIRSGEAFMGVVVEVVSEVLDVLEQDAVPMLALGTDIENSYIRGFGKCKGRVRILLDIDRVLTFSGGG